MRLAHRSPARRRGIVLLIVIALLELFAIVGLSFASYSAADRPGTVVFRPDLADLAHDTEAFAFFLSQDLGAIAEGEDEDLGVYSALRGRLQERAAGIDNRVRLTLAVTTDPSDRNDLRKLDRLLAAYVEELCRLQELLDLLRGPD